MLKEPPDRAPHEGGNKGGARRPPRAVLPGPASGWAARPCFVGSLGRGRQRRRRARALPGGGRRLLAAPGAAAGGGGPAQNPGGGKGRARAPGPEPCGERRARARGRDGEREGPRRARGAAAGSREAARTHARQRGARAEGGKGLAAAACARNGPRGGRKWAALRPGEPQAGARGPPRAPGNFSPLPLRGEGRNPRGARGGGARGPAPRGGPGGGERRARAREGRREVRKGTTHPSIAHRGDPRGTEWRRRNSRNRPNGSEL